MMRLRVALAGAVTAGLAVLTLAGCAPAPQVGEPTPPETSASQTEQPSGKVTLYIVRHGKTIFNDKSLVSGWSDSPLLAKGRDQAAATGKALKDVAFTDAFSSDLGRARDTANLVLAENANPPALVQLENLREQNYGGFEGDPDEAMWVPIMESMGVTYDPAKSTDGFWSNEEVLQWYGSHSEEEIVDALAKVDPLGSAENWSQYQERLQAGIDEVIAKSTGDQVLVVGHGGAIGSMLELMDPEGYNGESIANGSVSTVEYENGTFTILEISREVA
ncbi:MAG: histidine phosphatase family protein [Propionibacteriaceae bacterium]|nr:histidine phosphatase family protein [Propionibacteriaceae bacterium]